MKVGDKITIKKYDKGDITTKKIRKRGKNLILIDAAGLRFNYIFMKNGIVDESPSPIVALNQAGLLVFIKYLK